MGRRSINTTKSGKYMNPTDQARKEARKKELKKNKKQRQMVRAAVLKGKDPAQLIDEMEKIDEMEYNVLQPSPLNEKVLREKRKKLKETFDRVMRLYHNDDIELWNELRRKEHEYEKRRAKRVQYFESVRTAQTVSIEDIPLPDMTETSTKTPQPQLPFPSVPMPPEFHPQIAPPNIKVPLPVSVPKSNENQTADSKKKDPPGCPTGLPPDLFAMRELDSDYESEDSEDSRKSPISKKRRYSSDHSSSHSDDQNSASDNESDVPKPTSVQQRILAIAGQKYDDFMKELENVHKKDRNNSTSDDKQSKSQEGSNDDSSNEGDNQIGNESQDREKDRANDLNKRPEQSQNIFNEPPRPENPMGIPNISSVPMPPPMMKLPPPMGMPPMFRPPPMRHGMPGHNPMGMRMSGPMMPRLRMPPGPPPGLPPRMMQHHNMHRPQQQHMMQPPPKDTKGMTTITAKPQIRNLSADVTRFLPSTLRVKREDKKPQKPKPFVSEFSRQQQKQQNVTANAKGKTKDDAYMQFMREMQGLL